MPANNPDRPCTVTLTASQCQTAERLCRMIGLALSADSPLGAEWHALAARYKAARQGDAASWPARPDPEEVRKLRGVGIEGKAMRAVFADEMEARPVPGLPQRPPGR